MTEPSSAGVALAADGFQPVAKLDELELNEIRLVQIEGREVGIVRTAAGVFALGNRCPHQGAPICRGRVTGTMVASNPGEYVYGEEEVVVRCPWHGYEFSLATGLSYGGVTKGRVPVFPVEVRDGVVHCALQRVPVQESGA
jgi:3-phenylpropionate/trans-cinnamate dioxygenase ferredoxin subunit